MAKLELEKLRLHNLEVGEKGNGKEKSADVRDTIEDDLGKFCNELLEIRLGKAVNKKTNKFMKPRDLSFADALKEKYGFKDVNQFMKVFGIHPNSDNIHDFAAVLGLGNLNKTALEELMIAHSNFANPMATTEIDSTYRFIIPEIIGSAIRLGYQAASLHQNWISSTVNMSQKQMVMPQIKRGDGMPSRVNEGANIPMGSLSFGQKSVSVFKVGTGFKITDELMMASTLDMMNLFLQEVGNDMSIGADSLAFTTLINGEQADLSESAPVIGVDTILNGFAYKDLKKAFTRSKRLNQPFTRIVAGEDDGISITSIDRFEGFQGQTKLASIRSIIGVPEAFDIDTYVLPANKILFLNPARAMVKLSYRGLMTERRRNPQNQTEELYISDFINFAIIKRDARLIMDKSVTLAATPYPSYMDVDTRINESYQAL
jgi:HK97 family phage major capsid protein